MKTLFQYSLLQYHHSALIGEVMNVGVLVIFPEQRQIYFIHPERLTRLKVAYPNFPENVLRSYFKGIKARTTQLNKQPELFNDYQESPETFISNEILIRDSSALQFSKLKHSVLYSDNLPFVANQIAQLYLSLYDFEEAPKRHDDLYLVNEFRRQIKSKVHKSTKLNIIENFEVKEYRFPFAWKNGTLNLVDPVSFDLQKSDSIRRKADEQLGKLSRLQDFAFQKNANFDLLIARPKQSALTGAFNSAIESLHEIKNVRLWYENQIEEYSTKTINSISNEPVLSDFNGE